jgi:hypothetical protein
MTNQEENKEKDEDATGAESMNDEAQSQTSEEPSEFSGVIHASMEGTTEQEPLAQAYAAAEPSFQLEGYDGDEDDDNDGESANEDSEDDETE